ncbi:cysteine hydrolase [Cohaesibacter sp. CAU 1516]|uniref:cysteine hydrolase family protein n=1 Tax=Cohaesibacter sp. CAU 1516 TaxID=2576038 RepID=UPI001484CA3D|nr:cysteine hydrolase [Cohaesibacter sp. CAU 1516]
MNLILGLTLALIVFLMANGLYRVINRPRAKPIDKTARPNSALLVIDMQHDFTRASGKLAHDPERRLVAFHQINELAAEAHQLGIPVIEISHAFTDPLEKLVVKIIAGGAGIEGSLGLKRDDALTYEANYHVWKHEGDSFTAPMFTRYLDDHEIGHLYITGQDATACINATAKAALKRHYDVTLIDDAILARNGGKWQAMKDKLLASGARLATGLGLSASPV